MASPDISNHMQPITDPEQVARQEILEGNPTLLELREEADRRSKLSEPTQVDTAFINFTAKVLGVLDKEIWQDGDVRICDVNWTLATTKRQLYEDEERKRSIVENTDPEVC